MLKMINTIKVSFTILVLVFALTMATFVDTHYNREATVTEIENNTCIATDLGGDEWAFENNNFTIGEEVILKMHNNNTDNTFYDDIILDVKKARN